LDRVAATYKKYASAIRTFTRLGYEHFSFVEIKRAFIC